MSIINTAEIQKLKKSKLDKKGGSLNGPLYLSRDAVDELEAVNKGYVDHSVVRIDQTINVIDSSVDKISSTFNISVFEFNVPSSEWLVVHNMGTTRFNEKLLDKNHIPFFASVEIIDDNSFKVYLSEMQTGRVEVSFGY